MNSTSPTVSIIIPVHNLESWIHQTLKSVLAQTFTDFQCIVIDDGSTDASISIIQSFSDPRIHLIQQKHAGVSAARNTGIQHAQSPYVAFLDGDDLWHPQFLERMLAPFEKSPNAALSWCNTTMFLDETHTYKPLPWGSLYPSSNIWWATLQYMLFTVGAFIVKRCALQNIPHFDTTLSVGEDRDFILKLLASLENDPSIAPSIHVPDALKYYRIRPHSAVKQAHVALASEWSFMEKHLEHPSIPRSIRKKGYSNLAFKLAVISAFGTQNFSHALTWYKRAFTIDPWNLDLYFLPLKKLYLSLLPKKRVALPQH